MKVVTVRGVVVRAQHTVEEAARPLLQIGQQQGGSVGRSGGCFGLPIFHQDDALAAFQSETRNVQRVGGAVAAACAGVGRRAFAGVDVAAGVTAQVLQRDHTLTEAGQGGGLQGVALPHRQ